MTKIAIIGVGIMGHGMAENFLKAGHEVILWNRTPEKVADLVKEGAVLATNPKEATTTADIMFEVTANDESSRAVWQGDKGILAGADNSKALITSATLSIEWIDELAAQCEARHLTFFDMPLTGGRIGAETGQLTMLVGGNASKLRELEPALAAIAAKVNYFGKAGSGARYKLILNMMQAIHMAAYGEAMRIARSVGLEERAVSDALVARPGGVVMQIAATSYHHQPDPITFSVEWMAKDLAYAERMAKSVNHSLLRQVLAQYQVAVHNGQAQADWSKVNEL